MLSTVHTYWRIDSYSLYTDSDGGEVEEGEGFFFFRKEFGNGISHVTRTGKAVDENGK